VTPFVTSTIITSATWNNAVKNSSIISSRPARLEKFILSKFTMAQTRQRYFLSTIPAVRMTPDTHQRKQRDRETESWEGSNSSHDTYAARTWRWPTVVSFADARKVKEVIFVRSTAVRTPRTKISCNSRIGRAAGRCRDVLVRFG